MSINKHSLEKTGEVEVKGCALHYRFYVPHDPEKAAKTPLVIVHGGPGSCHTLLYDGMHELSDDRPTLYYDQRGSHFSPAPVQEKTMTIDQFVQDLDAVVNAVGIKKFALLGHSFGGMLVTAYTLKYQDKVSSLILSSPLLSSKVWTEDGARMMNDLGYDAQRLLKLELAGKTNDPYFCEATDAFQNTYDNRFSEDHKHAFQTHGKRFKEEPYNFLWGAEEYACTGVLKDVDYFDRLSEIKIPTQIMCGSTDSATAETMKSVQALIEGALLTVFSDSGHVSFFDNQDRYIKVVRAFLAG